MLNANLSEVTQLEMYGAGRFKWMASEPLLLTPMQYWIWLYDQCEYMYVGVCLNLSPYLSIYLSIHPPIHPFIYPSIQPASQPASQPDRQLASQ